MQVNQIRALYRYLFWAHDRVLAALEKLSPEELTRDLGVSHRSVRDTLVHMMSAQWIWLSRWHGVFPTAMLDPESFPTLEAVEERWAGIRRELQRFLSAVRDEDLVRAFSYKNTRGEDVSLPLGVAMQHVVNHDTYHRGQVTAMLRQLRHGVPSTDLLLFWLEEDVLTESARERGPASFVPSGSEEDGGEELD